jgi:hypothetical protein
LDGHVQGGAPQVPTLYLKIVPVKLDSDPSAQMT